MTEASSTARWRNGLLAGALVFATATLGRLATEPNIPTWYAGLAKPRFNPPDWVFAPVWGVLYLLMALAFYLVLSTPPGPRRSQAIAFFVAQLVLNAGWSWVFFGLRNPTAGIIVIVPLLGLIVLTAKQFGRIEQLAGILLAPYALWVGFATVLNVEIWRLN